MLTSAGSASPLRVQLRETIPELFDALERSWQIATSDWLPAISHNAGSVNSYPHLRNLEEHVTRVQSVYCSLHGSDAQMLTPAEIYVLLAGILFHDLGKCYKEGDHGDESANRVLAQFPALGIPNSRLAGMIARLARCHSKHATISIDQKSNPLETELKKLTTRAVEPYGEIREHCCAALLILADEMDYGFRRVVPDYTVSGELMGPTARMRRRIDGTFVDLHGRVVKTVLGDAFDDMQCGLDLLPDDPKVFGVELLTGDAASKQAFEDLRLRCIDALGGLLEETKDLQNPVEKARMSFNVAADRAREAIKRQTDSSVKNYLGKLINMGAAEPQANALDLWLCLNTLGAEVQKSNQVLKTIHPQLAAAGVFLDGWAVEHRESLFAFADFPNHKAKLQWWQETHEPALSTSYLARITQKMWQLSTEILGEGLFTYETLADAMREPRPERARRAVRRVAAIARRYSQAQPPIQVSQRDWRWIAQPHANKNEVSDSQRFDHLKETIANLVSPSSPNTKPKQES